MHAEPLRARFGLRVRVVAAIVTCAIVSMVIGGVVASAEHSISTATTLTKVVELHSLLAREYKSVRELKADSTLIVMGTVTGQQNVLEPGAPIPYTISTFHIEQVLQNRGSSVQSVQVRQTGGIAADGTKYVDANFPILAPAARYVLFLTPGLTAGLYYPVGAYQGVFAVSEDSKVDSVAHGASAIGVRVRSVPYAQFVESVQRA